MGEPESDLGTSTKTNDFLTQLTQRAKDRVDGKRASGVPSAISRSDDKTWPTSTEEKGTLSSQGTNARIRARLISVGPRPEHRWNIRNEYLHAKFFVATQQGLSGRSRDDLPDTTLDGNSAPA